MAGTTFGGRNGMQTYGWGRLISGIVAIFGLLLLAAPFVLNFAAEQLPMQNAVASGVLLALFGALAFFGAGYWRRNVVRAFDWLAALTGLWLLISPWVLDYQASGPAFWSVILIGLIGFIGGVVAALKQDETAFVAA